MRVDAGSYRQIPRLVILLDGEDLNREERGGVVEPPTQSIGEALSSIQVSELNEFIRSGTAEFLGSRFASPVTRCCERPTYRSELGPRRVSGRAEGVTPRLCQITSTAAPREPTTGLLESCPADC